MVPENLWTGPHGCEPLALADCAAHQHAHMRKRSRRMERSGRGAPTGFGVQGLLDQFVHGGGTLAHGESKVNDAHFERALRICSTGREGENKNTLAHRKEARKGNPPPSPSWKLIMMLLELMSPCTTCCPLSIPTPREERFMSTSASATPLSTIRRCFSGRAEGRSLQGQEDK